MEMSFHKLSSKLTLSSLWDRPNSTRLLFITMLSLKDDNGFVEASRTGLANAARLSLDDFDFAINDLMSPDPDSKSHEFDGRRIGRVEGGWVILNHGKYTDKESERKKKRNEYMKKYMAQRRAEDIKPIVDGVSAGCESKKAVVSKSDPELVKKQHLDITDSELTTGELDEKYPYLVETKW